MENHEYISLLKKELVSAQGCTEPISIAYCAAVANELLTKDVKHIHVSCSSNIIKNVKSVVIPGTDHKKGIETAVAAGIVAGDVDKGLEVLVGISDFEKTKINDLLELNIITVKPLASEVPLDIIIVLENAVETVEVRLAYTHSHIAYKKYNGTLVYESSFINSEVNVRPYEMNVKEILRFANTVDLEDIEALLKQQIDYNYAISEEGLHEDYGASIGKVLYFGCSKKDLRNRAKARAAAGSDARMNGCELPVVINSGSGNQGLTVSLPVIEYAYALNVDEARLYRALVVSNLCAMHLKSKIGVLSAFCGVISAGASAGAGIAYLKGGDYEAVCATLSNALATSTGVICDGAKASCAAKITIGVEAGLLGYEMYRNGRNFEDGDGIVSNDIEKTIENIGRIGRLGMRRTDEEILDIMTCFD